ncbi:MAG: TonB-dependent receptor [Bacteroidales bacterium]|nr:TonB-dependent receptor [Bacteroidales bacterium]
MRKIVRLKALFLSIALAFSWVTAFAQTGVVTGVVTDAQTGESIPGANVFIEGTTIGMSSSMDGQYSFDAPVGKQALVCSYIGYTTMTVEIMVVRGETVIRNFKIAEDNLQLDEIVVVGYGTERKRNITSSITTVKAQEIESIPVENFGKALQGRTPGVQITSDNGLPGGAVTFRIRGTSSIKASSEPLYVVDGVPAITGSYTNESGFPDKSNVLAQIDPADIASIEILKDAAAAAIYGARSANGVVLITTKKGKLGVGEPRTNFSFNYYAGVNQVTNRLKILDGPAYLRLTKEAWFNSGMGTEQQYYEQLPYGIYNTNLIYEGDYNKFTDQQKLETYEANKPIIDNYNTNWLDEMLKMGFLQNASLSASGGTARTQYFINGAYYGEQGFIISNSFKRINGRVNFSHVASDYFKFGSNVGVSYTINHRVPTGWAGGLGTAQSRSLPIMPVYNSTGGYFAPKSSNFTNVVATREDLEYGANTFSIIGNVFGEFNFTKWLSVRNDFGINNIYLKDNKYEGTITHELGDATDRRVQIESYSNVISLNLNKTFNRHNVTGFLGFQVQNSTQYGEWINGKDFPSPEMKEPGSAALVTADTWTEAYGFLSYIGRATYNFANKYYFTFSLRRDASSRFGPGNKWGWFPATSLGWTITEEKFFPASVKKVLSYLKIRGSYGITGNAEIGNYRYFGSYSSTRYNGEPAIRLDVIGNPNLGWEKTSQVDIGLDYGLWDGRLSGGFDFYYKYTSDMLLDVNIPQTSGASTVMMNVGSLENKGIEFFLTSNNLVGKFKWQSEFNINHNKNKILDIQGQIVAGENYGNNYAQEGYPVGAWRLVEYYGVDPETGQELFVLADGTIGIWDDTDPDFFDKNVKVVGNPYPTWFGGFNNIFSWKGFDASILFTYQWGNDVYRDDGKFLEGGQIGANWNQMTSIENHWTKPGDVAETPQLLWKNTYSTHNSTRYLDNGAFIRLKTFVIGYTLPYNWSKTIAMKSIRVYFLTQNLFTWTKYKGWDPEVNRDYSGNITQGVTYLSPPQAKTFSVGVNLNF